MSGTEANRSGVTLEQQVAAALRTNGIAFSTQFQTRWQSVLGKSIRSDFYLPHVIDFEEGLHIEVRWQDSSGSIDEKIIYLKENIQRIYTRPAVVVIDGSQVQAQYDYLKANRGGNLIDVFRLTEFLLFANELRTGNARRVLRETYNPDQGVLFA